MNKWDSYFIAVAKLTAELSYCEKLKVGAVAVRDNRIIATGFNGTLPGMDNCCEVEVFDSDSQQYVLQTKSETEHAERNLIAYAARNGIALKDATLYITHAPCIECAKSIINAGFKTVYWHSKYRSLDGLRFLQRFNISVSPL